MTILYSCRHDGDQYRISKFNDGDVESSYLTDGESCDCPAGHRRMCRHREMLPLFIRRGAVNTGWQLDYDRGGWVQMWEDEPAFTDTGAELPRETIPELPEGVQMFGMDDVLGIHNAIAEAVGEPEAIIPPPAKSWRRF